MVIWGSFVFWGFLMTSKKSLFFAIEGSKTHAETLQHYFVFFSLHMSSL